MAAKPPTSKLLAGTDVESAFFPAVNSSTLFLFTGHLDYLISILEAPLIRAPKWQPQLSRADRLKSFHEHFFEKRHEVGS